MRKLIKPIFWTFLFLVMMLAIDQFFVQVPPVHPAHAAVSDFYRDFRERLIDMTFGNKKTAPKSIEAVIEKQQTGKPPTADKAEKQKVKSAPPASDGAVKKPQRYLYSDGRGELHFTDSLDEVPDEYRAQAQPLGD
jgi:hypothetical protein